MRTVRHRRGHDMIAWYWLPIGWLVLSVCFAFTDKDSREVLLAIAVLPLLLLFGPLAVLARKGVGAWHEPEVDQERFFNRLRQTTKAADIRWWSFGKRWTVSYIRPSTDSPTGTSEQYRSGGTAPREDSHGTND